MLFAKSILDKPSDSDGYRLLVTCEWPDDFPPSWADGFNSNLAPSQKLYNSLISKNISFEEFSSKYSLELDLQKDRLLSLKKQAEKSPIMLISYPDFEGKQIGKIIIDKCKSI